MAVMKVKESRFGAPAGVYVGTFLGTAMMKDNGKPRLGNDGKPMEPGLEWQFEITDGEHAGQIVSRITSTIPTTKNAAGVLLAGMLGRPVRPDDEIDPDTYRGQKFQIVVSPGKLDPNKTSVSQLVKLNGQNGTNGTPKPPAAASPPATFAPPSPPAPPTPPRAPAPPAAPAAATEPKYWASVDGKTELVTGSHIREMVKDKIVPPTLPVMRENQEGGWMTAAAFGFDKSDSGAPLVPPPAPPNSPPF